MIGAIERLAVDGACDGAILMVGSIEELDDDGLGVALEITLLVGDTDGFDGASFGEGLKLGCRVFFGCFFLDSKRWLVSKFPPMCAGTVFMDFPPGRGRLQSAPGGSNTPPSNLVGAPVGGVGRASWMHAMLICPPYAALQQANIEV